jgi:Zn-dependent peptidase ImmA (M78 family)
MLKYSNHIKIYRNLRDLSQDVVVSKLKEKGIKISKKELSNYENGKIFLDRKNNILIELASLFKTSVNYLLMPQSELNLNYRKRKDKYKDKNITKTKQNLIDDIAKIYIENYLQLEKILDLDTTYTEFNNPIKDIEIRDRKDVLCACEKLRREWNDDKDVIESVFQLLEWKRIKIIEIDIDINNDNFEGVSLNNQENQIKNYIIIINKNIPLESQRFTILHELGHLLLNFAENLGKIKEENLCDAFASNMLIPNKKFEEIFAEYVKIDSFDIFDNLTILTNIQEKYGISIRSICFKLFNRGYISKDKYENFLKEIKGKNKDFIKKERFNNEIRYKNQNTYEELVYMAVEKGKITIDKALSLLDISYEQYD